MSCECDSFRGVPNCRCSLMNCVDLIECGLSLVSRVDVSRVCALNRVVCAVLLSVAQLCISVYLVFIFFYIKKIYFLYIFKYMYLYFLFSIYIDMHIVYDM